MEKAMRALAETENNAAAIRALQKKINGLTNNGNDGKFAAIDASLATVNTEIAGLKSADAAAKNDMDKLRDDADELYKQVNDDVCPDVAELKSKTEELSNKHACLCLRGVNSADGTTFGKIKSGGNVLAIVRFDSTVDCQLFFGGKSASAITSNPICSMLTEGEGILLLKPLSSHCVCLLYGDVQKV